MIQLCHLRCVGAPLPARFLLLVHQIPPRPSYLRVKIGRRLQALGAVAVKNSVYVLPRRDQALEDFQWVRREIVAGRGEATICEARFVDGLSDDAVERLFVAAREADYAALAGEVRAAERSLDRAPGDRTIPPSARAALARLRKRFAEIRAVDFFGASAREGIESRLDGLESRLRPRAPEKAPPPALPTRGLRGRTWVTRAGIHIDRMASAWLVRRFVDRGARIRFAPGPAFRHRRGEVRFDMSEAEFTHDGDLCTFEVLARRFRPDDPALRHLGEIVHDVDLKDGKFARPEASGLERLVAGIAARHGADAARLKEASAVFDSLYESFRITRR
jgi:hypothetical protein